MRIIIRRSLRLAALGVLALKLRPDAGEEPTAHELRKIDAALGDALRPDGTTDLERLNAQTHYFDLDAWRDKDTRDRTPVASPNHP